MNLKDIKKNVINKNGIFFTEEKLALYLRDELYKYSNDDIKEIFDITCGNGALLKVFDDNVIKYGSELNNDFVEQAKLIPNSIIKQCDILDNNKPFENKLFKHIIFNPPYSIKSDKIHNIFFNNELFTIKSNKDAYFLLSIIDYMDIDAVAVGIVFPGISYRNTEYLLRKHLIESGILREVELLDGKDMFIDTTIDVLKLVLVNNKNNNKVLFKHKDKSLEVSIEDIRKNDYSLSVNTYIEEENIPIERAFTINELKTSIIDGIKREIEFFDICIDMEIFIGKVEENQRELLKQDLINELKNTLENI